MLMVLPSTRSAVVEPSQAFLLSSRTPHSRGLGEDGALEPTSIGLLAGLAVAIGGALFVWKLLSRDEATASRAATAYQSAQADEFVRRRHGAKVQADIRAQRYPAYRLSLTFRTIAGADTNARLIARDIGLRTRDAPVVRPSPRDEREVYLEWRFTDQASKQAAWRDAVDAMAYVQRLLGHPAQRDRWQLAGFEFPVEEPHATYVSNRRSRLRSRRYATVAPRFGGSSVHRALKACERRHCKAVCARFGGTDADDVCNECLANHCDRLHRAAAQQGARRKWR